MIRTPRYNIVSHVPGVKIELVRTGRLIIKKNQIQKITITKDNLRILKSDSTKNNYSKADLKFLSIILKHRYVNLKTIFPQKFTLKISLPNSGLSISQFYNGLINILNLDRHRSFFKNTEMDSDYTVSEIPDLYSNYSPKYKYVYCYEKDGHFVLGNYSTMQLLKPDLKINLSTGLVKLKTLFKTVQIRKDEILDIAIDVSSNQFRNVNYNQKLETGKLILLLKSGNMITILNTMGHNYQETSNIDINKKHEIEYELLRIRRKLISRIYSS